MLKYTRNIHCAIVIFMRIGIIVPPVFHIPPTKYGGSEIIAYYLINGLIERGHTVILFGAADSDVACEIVPLSDTSLPIKATEQEDIPVWKKRLEAQKNIRTLVQENLHRLDVLHSFGFDMLPFADFPTITRLSSPFNIYNYSYFRERQDKLFFTTLSNDQQHSFPELNYVGTVYNGFDPNLFPFVDHVELKNSGDASEEYCCYIGRLSRELSPHISIEVAVEKNIPIKIAGPIMHWEQSYVKKDVEPHFSNPLVTYLGEIGMPEKTTFLGNALANIHITEVAHTFGNSIIEAAYTGTPTITLAKGGPQETIEDGKTGILAETPLHALMQFESVRTMDRKYISETARKKFNYKIMTEQYEMAYENICAMYSSHAFQNSEKKSIALKHSQQQIRDLWKKRADERLF